MIKKKVSIERERERERESKDRAMHPKNKDHIQIFVR
jgi:hypothetical protein